MLPYISSLIFSSVFLLTPFLQMGFKHRDRSTMISKAFSHSCLRKLASWLELGSQVGSTTDHLSNCCLNNTLKIPARRGLRRALCLAKMITSL